VKAASWRANTFSYSRQDACAPRRLVKAARWRANTFDYCRKGGSCSQPGISLSGSLAIERGSKRIEAVLSWMQGHHSRMVRSPLCTNLVCFDLVLSKPLRMISGIGPLVARTYQFENETPGLIEQKQTWRKMGERGIFTLLLA
jgi:hypothetical protein